MAIIVSIVAPSRSIHRCASSSTGGVHRSTRAPPGRSVRWASLSWRSSGRRRGRVAAARSRDARARGEGGGSERGPSVPSEEDNDDAAPASTAGGDGDGEEGREREPTLAEATEKFTATFWDEIEKNPGGVPFLRKMNQESQQPAADASSSAARTTSGVAFVPPETEPEVTVEVKVLSKDDGGGGKRLGFWQRCTVIGLAIGLWMGYWGLSSVHWPTVWWVAQRPNALAWSPELGWSIIREVALRLGAPILRIATAWFAVRSTWPAMWACGIASAIVPIAEGL